jgi:hypothetical protein
MRRVQRRRRGYNLVDATVGLALLGVVLALAYGMLASLARSRESADVAQCAAQAASNALERVLARPALEEGAVPLDAEFRAQCPGAEAWVEVEPDAGQPAGRFIRLTLTWPDPGTRRGRSVSLVGWRPEEATP